MDCLEAARAWEVLHDPEVAPRLTTEATLDTALLAGYSRPEAEAMARRQGLERLRRDETL